MSNGIYRSIEHRATVNSVKKRLSVATFYSPRWEGDMGPKPSLITPESPALLKRIGVADYFKGYFSRELDGKLYLDVMRIQNEEEKGT
jgi:isopenicillin N synthase-like dioxygenase